MSCQVRLLKICPRVRDRVDDQERGEAKQVGRSGNVRCAFPESPADWLLTLVVMHPKIGRESADTLSSNFQHDRCNEEKQASAELSGEGTRDYTTNDSANRPANCNKSKKSFALVRCENVGHERPKHRCGEKIEDADPNEKNGRKDCTFLRRWHPAHKQKENQKV